MPGTQPGAGRFWQEGSSGQQNDAAGIIGAEQRESVADSGDLARFENA